MKQYNFLETLVQIQPLPPSMGESYSGLVHQNYIVSVNAESHNERKGAADR